MRFYILFFVLLIISCSETINWDVELNECSFEVFVEENDFFVPSGEMVKQYLFLKNLDNSAKTYNFILEQSEKVFSGEVVSGRYMAVYYFLVSKMVSGKKKFYTQAYFVDTFLLSESNKNQKNIVPVTIKNPFRAIRYDDGKIIITKDLSYDFFQIYKISALSMNVSKKVKSYDYSDDENFYFEDVDFNENKLIVNLSYSIGKYCNKNFLSEHDIAVTTTRIENLDISELIK